MTAFEKKLNFCDKIDIHTAFSIVKQRSNEGAKMVIKSFFFLSWINLFQHYSIKKYRPYLKNAWQTKVLHEL